METETIFILAVLLVFVVLDIIMLVSLLKPGDERNQIIVWKAWLHHVVCNSGGDIIRMDCRFYNKEAFLRKYHFFPIRKYGYHVFYISHIP